MDRQTLVWKVAERLAGKISDRLYLSVRYYRRFGRWPALTPPSTFNEHLLAYKLTSRGDDRLPVMSDKAAVKDWVAERLGRRYVIPTIWVGDTLPPREHRTWPKPYVMKSTHGSAQTIFVRDEVDERWDEIETRCAKWLDVSRVYGRRDREWHYAAIKPQIIVEPMIGENGVPPADVKFFTFAGRVGMIQVDLARFSGHRRHVYDRTWTPMPFHFEYLPGPDPLPRPANLERMIELAETVAAGFEFVRVDFYDTSGGIFFGEATFFPAAGNGPFIPPEADFVMGGIWTELAAAGADGRDATTQGHQAVDAGR